MGSWVKMLTFRAHFSGLRWSELRKPLVAVAVAMVGGAGLAALWSFHPGLPSLVVVMAMAVAVGWLSLGLVAASLEGDAAARDEAEQLRTFRQEIVATISHELRTPLTVIQGLTSVLNSRWDALPEARKLDLIDTIQLNVASLDASILHFVDAGRLVRGEYQPAPELIGMGDVAAAVVAKLSGVLAGHEVQVE